MEKKYYKNYQYYAFYQNITGVTKIIINSFVDARSGYISIAEISMPGELSEAGVDFLAMDKIHEIEELA
jgi:hypothetical protein